MISLAEKQPGSKIQIDRISLGDASWDVQRTLLADHGHYQGLHVDAVERLMMKHAGCEIR
jgi:hypothetical protein